MKKVLVGFGCAWLMIAFPAWGADNTRSDLAQLVNSARHNDAIAVQQLIQRSLTLYNNARLWRNSSVPKALFGKNSTKPISNTV